MEKRGAEIKRARGEIKKNLKKGRKWTGRRGGTKRERGMMSVTL